VSRHLELVDAVNNAKTLEERKAAHSYLRGWREGWANARSPYDTDVDVGGLIIEADLYAMWKYGEDADMHGGVLMDWEPNKAVK